MMLRMVVLVFLILALVEGFIDRGFGAPCMVAGSSAPGAVFAAAVLAAVAWATTGAIAIPL